MPELLTQIILFALLFLLIRFLVRPLWSSGFAAWLGIVVFILVIVISFFDPGNRTVGIFWAILSFPLRPLGLVLLLLSYAIRFFPFYWWGAKVDFARTRVQVLTAFWVLFLCSLPITAYFLTAQNEQRVALEASQRPAGNVEAVVVLGDATSPTDPVYRMRTQLSNPLAGLSVTLESRLIYATQLYNTQVSQGSNPLLVVAVGPQAVLGRPGTTVSDAITAFLGRLGVPAERIRIDTDVIDPRDAALTARQILRPGEDTDPDCSFFTVCENATVQRLPTESEVGPVVPIVLVAPSIYIRRATSTFINVRFEVFPRATDFYVFQIQGGLRLAALTDLIPNAEALTVTSRVVDEYLAWIYYFMRGWLNDPLDNPFE